MSTGAEQPTDDGADDEPETVTPHTALMNAARRAEKLGITPGRGRAAWVLDQYADAMPGEGQVQFGGPYSAGEYRCDECGEEPNDHPGVRVLMPSQDAPGGPPAAVLAGPFCPGCAVRLLSDALR